MATNIFSRFFGGTRAAAPVPQFKAMATTPHEAGSRAPRTRGWTAPTVTAESVNLSAKVVRDRARHAWRNDSFARGACERMVSAIVGSVGFTPLSQSPDPKVRAAIRSAWNAWATEAGAGMTQDFAGLMTAAVREWLVSGESWLRIRPRKPGDMASGINVQLELLPAEAVVDSTQQISEARRVLQGVEVDAIGRVVGYHVQDLQVPSANVVVVPVDKMLHLWRQDFPGTTRGISFLSPALSRLRELDLYLDASLVRAQQATMLAGFVTGDALLPDDNNEITLQPGQFERLAPGDSVTWSDPPSVDGQSFDLFVRSQLTAVAAALHMSYSELTGDARDLTDRVLRVQRLDTARAIAALQYQCVEPVLAAIWRAWLPQALAAGKVPIPDNQLDAHLAVEWVPERQAHYHPEQDEQALEKRLRLGRTSRSALLAEDGVDCELLDQQIAADNKRADNLGLRFDGDARAQAAAPAAAPQPEPVPPTKKAGA